MNLKGEALSTQRPSPDQGGYNLTFDERTATFELPSLLNIGASYDFLFGDLHRLTVVGNFTANSFSRDEIGGGLEYSLNNLFMLRGGYRYELGLDNELEASVYKGLSAGVSIEAPLSKENKKTRLGFDYSYRQTRVWNGTHNFSVRISI